VFRISACCHGVPLPQRICWWPVPPVCSQTHLRALLCQAKQRIFWTNPVSLLLSLGAIVVLRRRSVVHAPGREDKDISVTVRATFCSASPDVALPHKTARCLRSTDVSRAHDSLITAYLCHTTDLADKVSGDSGHARRLSPRCEQCAQVVVTREAGKNGKLANALQKQGISVLEMPLVKTSPGPERCNDMQQLIVTYSCSERHFIVWLHP